MDDRVIFTGTENQYVLHVYLNQTELNSTDFFFSLGFNESHFDGVYDATSRSAYFKENLTSVKLEMYREITSGHIKHVELWFVFPVCVSGSLDLVIGLDDSGDYFYYDDFADLIGLNKTEVEIKEPQTPQRYQDLKKEGQNYLINFRDPLNQFHRMKAIPIPWALSGRGSIIAGLFIFNTLIVGGLIILHRRAKLRAKERGGLYVA